MKTNIQNDQGLMYALCAIGFFRGRHSGRPRFKHSKRYGGQMTYNSTRAVYMARHYIALARKHGWRGSIVQAVTEGGVT